MRIVTLCIFGALFLSSCTPPPPVEQSRAVLWQRFGNHSIDEVLLAWGTPAKETKLTTGARLVSYERAITVDAASPYERTHGCEVSFLAPPPGFIITNVAMNGEGFQCAALASHGPGYARNMYVPPPPPPVIYPGGAVYYR